MNYISDTMAYTKRILGSVLACLAILATLAMPALASVPDVEHRNASHGAMYSMASHQHEGSGHNIHGLLHGSDQVKGPSDARPDLHEQHGSCSMATCCPVASIAPQAQRSTTMTMRSATLPDLRRLLRQAHLDTSDKPPRHI